MVDFSVLMDKFYHTPAEEIEELEELLPRAAGKIAYGVDNPSLLSKVAKDVSVQTTAKEQIESSRELSKHLKAIDVVAYRPHILDFLESSALKSYIPHRIFNFFDENDYHDRFLRICGEDISKGSVEDLKTLVKSGYEHVVWTNICDKAINNFRYSERLRCNPLKPTIILEKPDYPSEFFTVLSYLEQVLKDQNRKIFTPLPEENKERKFPEKCLEEVMRLGKLEKVGFASINRRSLRQVSVNLLNSLGPNIAYEIEANYLDREIETYLENLNEIKEHLVGIGARRNLEVFRGHVDRALDCTMNIPSSRDMFGIISNLEGRLRDVKRMKMPFRNQLPQNLQEYRSIFFRRSKNYLAASIDLEAMCHASREFPFITRQYEFEPSFSESESNIFEMPTKNTIRELAKKFRLSSSTLKNQHLKTAKICRRSFSKEIYNLPEIT